MKIIEAIQEIDNLKFNAFTQDQKVGWLSRLDNMVKTQIIDTHEGGEGVSFTGYDSKTNPQTELLIPSPFDVVYLRWMEAQIDYHNGEYDKFNNSIIMYNTALDAYQKYYTIQNRPVQRGRRFLF